MTRPPTPPPTPPSPSPFPTAASRGGTESSRPSRRLWLARDDDSEQGESFDALTDLFLGEVSRSRRPDQAARDARPDADQSRPLLRLTTDEPDEVPASQSGSPSTSGVHERPPARAPMPPFVECVVVGNLPVLASAWASQYVREVARAAERPVAYLRVQAGFVTVEIVGEIDGEAGTIIPVTPAAADLDAALRQAASITERWVVRVDHADEAAIASRPSVRLVTLITGPDEAARVHAYGSLKELGERLPKGDSGPVVRVAVMSAAESDAAAAGQKLVDTVRQFLGRDVQHAVCSAKIRATRAAQLIYNGRLDQPTSHALEKLEHVLDERGRSVATANEPATPRRSVLPPPQAASPPSAARATAIAAAPPEPVEPSPALPLDTEPQPKSLNPPESRMAEVAPPPPPPAVPAARPSTPPTEPAAPMARIDDVSLWAAEPERGQRGDAGSALDRDLASFIPGCRTLPAKCPYAENVQIAVDAEGAVQLLVRSSGPSEDEPALAALMVAAAWVDAHAALLNALAPGLNGRSRTMHLFTAAPKASRRLLETDVRIHVLAPVRVGDRVGWCCVELN